MGLQELRSLQGPVFEPVLDPPIFEANFFQGVHFGSKKRVSLNFGDAGRRVRWRAPTLTPKTLGLWPRQLLLLLLLLLIRLLLLLLLLL